MKRKISVITVSLILASASLDTFAQRIDRIYGNVCDDQGCPIANAYISEVDVNQRTIGATNTDESGLFNLNIRNSANNMIHVIAKGYEQAVIPIDQKMFRVTLHPTLIKQMPPPGKAVDLGLSVKWADRNVGADSPTETGCFYAWGEINEKSNYSWSDNLNTDDDIIDSDTDAAHTYWKQRWTMPSDNDIAELVNRCVWTWAKVEGVLGFVVTGPSGNSIFMPAGGMRSVNDKIGRDEQGNYWSGSRYETRNDCAYALEFDYRANRIYHGHRQRHLGMMIRPVWR